IELQDLEKVPIIMAIAGGKSKAKAIRAYMKNAPKQTWLITDEMMIPTCGKKLVQLLITMQI
ncbi:sugar-binding domain-containing protein, partial [Enterococcus faecium]|uniref:sugar-binding domain-containing protein n=1 Tax=Enterococcus faecium TaxID=1352 RepID=UPI002931D407